MSRSHIFVVVYGKYDKAEAAIGKIRDSGFDVKRLSLLGADYRRDRLVGRYRSSDGTRYWENLNSLSSGVWSQLSGVAFFHIPDMGPFLVGGPLASAIIGSLEGSNSIKGLGPIGSGLYILGIAKTYVPKYEKAVQADNYLVIVPGTDEQIANVKSVVKMTDFLEFDLHQI